ncbi:MAG: TonB family protein [Deltaproteobacteria bacterium]|nr:TonB family protein [Candidatus Tharpella sp.]
MFLKPQSGSFSGLNLLIALTGAILINLLIMVLIPWLFRGGSGSRDLPPRLKEPVFVVPAKLEQEFAPSQREPEPQPEVKLPKPLPEPIQPVFLKPEINPDISQSRIKLDPRIESNLQLHPDPVATKTPAVKVLQREFYRVGELDSEPVSQGRMEPIYPFRARRRGIEGSVKIRFFVTRAGQVTGLEIIKAEPVGFFEKAIRQTVSNWHFQPGIVDGAKVKTLVETTIVFKLDR